MVKGEGNGGKYEIKNFFKAVAICLIISTFISGSKSGAATYLSISATGIKNGRVTNITKSKIVYRRQTGSSPESWAKPKTLKIVSSTKFYKCIGYNSSYTKYKLKKIGKAKAIKAIYNNGSNYVFFKTSGKKAKKVIYGMEKFVG